MKQEVGVFTIVLMVLLPTLLFVFGVVSNFRNIKRLRKEWPKYRDGKPKWREIFSTDGVYGHASIKGGVCMGCFYCFISVYAIIALAGLITYLIVK